MQLYQKETLTQVFSCEFCEIFKSNYFVKHLQTAISVSIHKDPAAASFKHVKFFFSDKNWWHNNENLIKFQRENPRNEFPLNLLNLVVHSHERDKFSIALVYRNCHITMHGCNINKWTLMPLSSALSLFSSLIKFWYVLQFFQ